MVTVLKNCFVNFNWQSTNLRYSLDRGHLSLLWQPWTGAVEAWADLHTTRGSGRAYPLEGWGESTSCHGPSTSADLKHKLFDLV